MSAIHTVARCVAWHRRYKHMVLAADHAPHMCTAQCDHWVDIQTHRSVCTRTLKVHDCGERCTAERVLLPKNEGYMCPYTRIVFNDVPLVQTSLFTQDGRCANHWAKHGPQERCKRARETKPMSHSDCVRIATGIVSGKHRAVIRIVEIKRAAKRLRKAIKQKAPSTFVQYASIVAKHTAMASPVPDQLVAAVLMDKLCSAIYRYTSKHTTCVFGTYDVTVATWLTMLSVGVRSGDVQIVPCVPQLQRMMRQDCKLIRHHLTWALRHMFCMGLNI